ncbi:hypothetical protein FB451DRAFT_1180433 [Mycena latifolia]|nr:hypothetical protein FB451DRAFT_1180433 [Mycena latifolia]
MGLTVQISNWKQDGGLRLIGRLPEQVVQQYQTGDGEGLRRSLRRAGKPLKLFKLSHQMNSPVCAWCTNIKLGMVEASDAASDVLGSLPSCSTISPDEFTCMCMVHQYQTGDGGGLRHSLQCAGKPPEQFNYLTG